MKLFRFADFYSKKLEGTLKIMKNACKFTGKILEFCQSKKSRNSVQNQFSGMLGGLLKGCVHV